MYIDINNSISYELGSWKVTVCLIFGQNLRWIEKKNDLIENDVLKKRP
jgi:hypothetical protein